MGEWCFHIHREADVKLWGEESGEKSNLVLEKSHNQYILEYILRNLKWVFLTSQPAHLQPTWSHIPCDGNLILFLCSQISHNLPFLLSPNGLASWFLIGSIRSYQIQSFFCPLPPYLCTFLLLYPPFLYCWSGEGISSPKY